MRLSTLAGILTLGILGASAAAPQDPHPSADGSSAQVADMFQNRCVTCHQAPDPAFATDRAWLSQVLDTA